MLTTTAAVVVPRTFSRRLALAVGGSLFLAASAQAAVPVWPVPFTMQTFAVVVLGLALGTRLGLAAVALYLMEGAAGLPVFANFSGGAPVFAGPTAGYLLGFVPAVVIAGAAGDRGLGGRATRALAPAGVATFVVLAAGTVWLGAFFGGDAMAAGFWPFVPGACAKIVLAAMAAPVARSLVAKCWR